MAKEQSTITAPVEKELTSETIQTQLKEKVEYYNKLVPEKDRLIGEANKVTEAMTLVRGEISALQNLQNEYFVNDLPSVNGEK